MKTFLRQVGPARRPRSQVRVWVLDYRAMRECSMTTLCTQCGAEVDFPERDPDEDAGKPTLRNADGSGPVIVSGQAPCPHCGCTRRALHL